MSELKNALSQIDLIREGVNILAKENELMKKALVDIASYDDVYAWDKFHKSGSFSRFDEPASVKIAHKVLSKIK